MNNTFPLVEIKRNFLSAPNQSKPNNTSTVVEIKRDYLSSLIYGLFYFIYAELIPLKALAEKLSISIVLVHHLRKAIDSDPFNMISGSTGLNGCVDGMLVLKKDKRCGGQAVLYATGRDIEDCELSLTRQGARWVLTDEREDKPPDTFVFAVHDLMVEYCSFKGSATEFCGLLKEKYGGEYFANRLTRDMFRHAYELRDLGVTFEIKRSNGQRLLLIHSATSRT